MGYTHEEFAEILNIEQSTSYYMCKNIRMNSITPEKLLAIFAVDYNTHLFIRKRNAMEKLLNKAIDDGKIQPKMTLRKIFGSKAKIVEGKNPSLCKPPIEIFTEQKCLIDRKFFVPYRYDAKIFDDEIFPEENQYVQIPTPKLLDDLYKFSMVIVSGKDEDEKESEKERLEKSKRELNRIQQHMIKRIEWIISVQNQNYLKQEYWLFAMYFLYKEVEIYNPCYEFIKKCYLQNGKKDLEWLPIFKILGRNGHIKNPSEYENDDCLYFRDNKENEITKDNLPVFYYKYRTSYKDGNSELQKKYFKNYYAEEICNVCSTGKIKLIHLFSILNQYYLGSGQTDDAAFKSTCLKLHTEKVVIPILEKLELFSIPKIKSDMDLESKAYEFYQYVKMYFKENTINENESEFIKFRDNFMTLGTRLFDVIAIDFDFIKKLSANYDTELNEILKSATEKYRKDTLIE